MSAENRFRDCTRSATRRRRSTSAPVTRAASPTCAGWSAATWPAVTRRGGKQMAWFKKKIETDVLVIGSGGAGLSAALAAAHAGARVMLAEKTDKVGGTTAVSGGVLWVP